MELQDRVKAFVERTLAALGLPLDIAISETPDSVRIDLSGDQGDVLLRRRAESLDALQHIVNTAFRRELDGDRTFVVDCLDYRKSKDAELRQMAQDAFEDAVLMGVDEAAMRRIMADLVEGLRSPHAPK